MARRTGGHRARPGPPLRTPRGGDHPVLDRARENRSQFVFTTARGREPIFRYSRLFGQEHVRGSLVADALAEVQMRWPRVPIVFCETRRLAQDWTCRFLTAALAEMGGHQLTGRRVAQLLPAPALGARPPSTREIRRWARAAGHEVAERGTLRADVVDAYRAAHDTAAAAAAH